MIKNELLIDSSGYVLNFIEKILDAKVEIKGIQNIPKNNPCIFVSNHFTRIEALLVPYALYGITNNKVGVIADDSLFDTAIGSFIKNLGALKKSDPCRNNLMLGGLLTKGQDWLIFPEGRMVKAKDITKDQDHYCVNIDNVCQRVYTGAAFFALNSQLLRKNYLNKNIKNIKKFKRKYFINDESSISKHETKVIPINISYSKLRKGDNFLMTMVDKLFDDMGENFKEELEIESNIILNSTITINILEPISTNDILKNKYNKELDHRKIINKYRHDLTHHFMTKVYENLTISFDHIFILTLYLYPFKTIEINHLKRVLYLIFNDVKHSGLFFTNEFNDSLLDLISYEKHKAFDEIINIAIRDNIIVQNGDTYIIEKKNLLKVYDHNEIRLKNILKVLLNEILLINEAHIIVSYYANQKPYLINEALGNLLEEEELTEFEEDYKQFWHHKGIKDKNIGKPFVLNASSDTCVIAIHGFSSAPKEVEKLALFLNNHNINVYAPRLKGHGTVSEDLKNTTWNNWYDSLSRAIVIATLRYKKVFLLGFSTGGLLALVSSKKDYKEFAGLICINAALNLNDIRVKTLIPAVTFWNDLVSAVNAKSYAKEYVNNKAQNPEINYDKHYIDSINQLKNLMAKCKKTLKNVKTPIYIIQSSDDPVVNPSSAYEIFDAITDENKKLEIVDSKYHVIITQENKKLFDRIKDFILH